MLTELNGVVVAPGLVIEKNFINSEFGPGEVPPRNPCQSGLLPTEDSVDAAPLSLVSAPPMLP
jgi:hypothetical protein